MTVTGVSPLVVVSAVMLLVVGCTHPPSPDPHYVLGKPYQVNGFWFYPQEAYALDETGLAAVAANGSSRLTTDGEVFDQSAVAAGHPTIQPPALARLTNLENGRAITVRLNDRGSGDPHRLVEVTTRTAVLLGMPPHGVVRVRLRVLPVESRAAADALPGAPSLALTAAPRGAVEVAELPPPAGVRQRNEPGVPVVPLTRAVQEVMPPPPMRLPETVTETTPQPGQLMVRLDTFSDYQFAAGQRARMAAAGARIVTVADGRSKQFRVEVGPLADVAHADAVLDRAFASNIPDARIVVD